MNFKSIIVIFSAILFSVNAFSQEWKKYPYTPEKSLISFPKDEGRHIDEPTEWWYFFSHLKGETSGMDYTVMFTFFYRDTLVFDGMRILNISNETTGEFIPDFKPVTYIINSEDHLEIKANLFDHNEIWMTKKDSTGSLIPFEYSLRAQTPKAVLDIDMKVTKHPLILQDSGFLYQGINNYTYYYSFTEMEVAGFLTLNNVKEKVTGTGWFDKQYGNFHPNVGEKYEWFSIKLSNNMDINTWNIFTLDNKLPVDPKYKLLNCYINDSTFFNTYNFDIVHEGYFYSPDSARIYGKRFRLIDDSLDMNLEISIQNPNCEPLFPFAFYEGPISIEGTVAGQEVTGIGFGELLHYYEPPQLEFTEPSGYWDYQIPIQWTIKNKDEGRPLTYDLLAKKQGDNTYQFLAKKIVDTFFTIDTSILSIENAYNFMIISYSVDSFFIDSLISDGYFKPNTVIDNINEKIVITPNPFSSKLSIDLKSNDYFGGYIELLSSDGKCILKRTIDTGFSNIVIDTDKVKEGIYLLKISKDNRFVIKKVIKTKK